MFHVLNINKPPGPTSREVVNRVQRLVRPAKAGHAGTLDPIASGVLVVCVGQATRLNEYAQALPKSYRGTFLLGHASETGDAESDVRAVDGAVAPTVEEVRAMLPRFTGAISQRPPRHSAVKIAGRRAYELAREGVEFEPAAKRVEIYRLAIVRYEHPELVLDVDCGSGTYIRSLGRDIAAALGTTAVMTALERTAIGPFSVESALAFDAIAAEWESHLQSPARLVAGLPRVEVSAAELAELQHGRRIPASGEAAEFASGAEIAAFDAAGELVAILREKAPGMLAAVRNFTRPD